MNNQSNDDSEISQDQYFVSELYLNGNKPSPSKNIDSAVLAMAKQQITVKPLWRRWQYAGSVAASVLIVSFLFMRNQTEITQELAQQDIFMADAFVQSQSNQEKEPQLINVVGARVSRLTEDKSNYKDSLSKQTEAIFKQVQVAKQKFEELELRELREQAAAQSSRMKIEELSLSQKKRSELKVEQSSESNYENLQNALFEKLLEQKSLSSDWKLSEKYINVLTLEQIRKLRRQE